jgi:acyl phosphate:glycerol-3-phosphate acyltransferase
MSAHPILISAALGYLLGSIPFGYVLVRIFRGTDVRESGSGNIGATNVARTSPALGGATLALDALKGLAAVLLIQSIFPGSTSLAFLAALAAICGHVFPPWLGFRGGKGVATGLGAFVLLTPKAILVVVGVFLIVAAVFRTIALASIFAAACLPAAVWLCGEGRGVMSAGSPRVSLLMLIVPALSILAGAGLIIARHSSNIRRILAGTEPKFQLRHK